MGQHEIPESFFADLEEIPPVRNAFGVEHKNMKPSTAIKWYDSIIDDILANPGTDLTATAKRLGRHPNTVQAIARSDLFRMRFEQRRAAFEAELDRQISAKLTKAANLALDATIETLEKKRDAIPLPILNETLKTSLDRLGYGPKPERAEVNVHLNNNVVSAEALAQAREKLKQVEGVRVRDPEPPVAGQGAAEREGD